MKRKWEDFVLWAQHQNPNEGRRGISRPGKREQWRRLHQKKHSVLTISKVHTLRIHTFNFPCTPSTSFNSTPSHQHLLAGFRQNSKSFCAIPTAFASLPLEPPGPAAADEPRMSVRRRANAREQMTALLGSGARWPHASLG